MGGRRSDGVTGEQDRSKRVLGVQSTISGQRQRKEGEVEKIQAKKKALAKNSEEAKDVRTNTRGARFSRLTGQNTTLG